MADVQPPDAEVPPELRQAWLTEYQVCEDQANALATWLWTASGIFLAGWITGLGVVAANVGEFGRFLWVLAGLAVLAQLLWCVFMARSLRMRQYLFLRQRQIEAELGMLKGIAINIADTRPKKCKPDNIAKAKKTLRYPRQARDLDDFAERAEHISSGVLENPFLWFGDLPPLNWFGRGGRAPLYLLSLLVGLAWLGLAVWAQWCQG